MRPLLLAAAAALLAAAPAAAQGAQDEAIRVNQLIVYGEDRCPAGGEDEIVVCARMPEDERFRIPPGLAENRNDPASQSWTNRAIELSYVGRSGIGSCSPAGAGGFIGCHDQLVRQARAERAAGTGIDWTALVAEAREDRMRRIASEIAEDEQARGGGD